MRRAIAITLMVGAIGIGACGDDDAAGPESTTATTTATTTTDAAPEVATPADLGVEIGDVYLSAFDELVALLADRPDPAAAAAQLSDLKESKIQELVALGREREALGPADRTTVDARISAALSRLPSETFEEYQDALTFYASDAGVSELLRDFNIIGQYANFDLLRDQEPEEAARLGVG